MMGYGRLFYPEGCFFKFADTEGASGPGQNSQDFEPDRVSQGLEAPGQGRHLVSVNRDPLAGCAVGVIRLRDSLDHW